MSAFLLSILRLIEKGNLYIEHGEPVLFFEVESEDVRRATVNDLHVIQSSWTSLMGRLVDGRTA